MKKENWIKPKIYWLAVILVGFFSGAFIGACTDTDLRTVHDLPFQWGAFLFITLGLGIFTMLCCFLAGVFVYLVDLDAPDYSKFINNRKGDAL